MSQLEHIGEVENGLWEAADTLRSNSKYASNEYFMPVMGLLFLRHAYSRFLRVKKEIEANLPSRGGKTRALTKQDFSAKGAIFLQKQSQYDYLVSLPSEQDRAAAIAQAMTLIEDDYESLKGQLPKQEYADLDGDVLNQLLDKLDPEALKKVDGDVFGRIYEYFLTKFADLKAHDNGEFFTPISLVSLIANVLEPTRGIVLDPACGSGGMFVQSARLVNNPQELTFIGLEKNPTTIRLAKMNLAVHGLEGNIQDAITYYTPKPELVKQANYVMANLPFNVDEVDATKVESDPRLPFGLPGVNKNKKVSNGNYLWISYFYTYLNEQGRAGFVMSSQASSAGRDEGKVRQKLIETGDVDIMIAIRNNFFYTLKPVRYFFRQVQWLMVRFPDGVLRDVEGLVKLVDRAEIEANDWSLTPGRYVGVAPEAVDEDFDFEEALRDIHVELQDLNKEAMELAAQIAKNFEELGV